MSQKFSDALRVKKAAGYIPVIPDIKCRSPKEGDLLRGRDPIVVAKILAQLGAPTLSVVTETKNFGGSLKLLKRVVTETKLPVLRKDFITCPDDLYATRDCGAAAVLLICAIQPFPQMAALYEEALKLGLEPLVEAHTKEELLFAEEIGAKLVGINNRNILQLEKDEGTVSATELFAPYKPQNSLLVSESSLSSPTEAQSAIRAGADALLIGTAIWQARNLVNCYRAFSQKTEDGF